MTNRESLARHDLMDARVPFFVGFLALFLLVGVLGYWGIKARLAGAVIASGAVEVQSKRQVVQHRDGGVVRDILARDGDTVDAGQVLVRFDGKLLTSELAIVEGQLFEILARQTRLRAERDNLDDLDVDGELAALVAEQPGIGKLVEGQQRLLAARRLTDHQEMEFLKEQVSQIEAQISGNNAQLSAQSAQLELVAVELAGQNSLLQQGLTQANRVTALKREQARLDGESGKLRASIAQLMGKIAAKEIEYLRLVATRRENAIAELRELQPRLVELRERRLSLMHQLSQLEVRAPVGGVIYGSQVFAERAVVQPAEPMMYVVPQDQPLLIAARVASLDIDQVQTGQNANIRFSTFNQRVTPELRGRVTTLSPDTYIDETSGLSFYRAEIVLADGEVEKLDGKSLIPGMPVEAFIVSEMRSPLSYLTKPVMEYFYRAFRE